MLEGLIIGKKEKESYVAYYCVMEGVKDVEGAYSCSVVSYRNSKYYKDYSVGDSVQIYYQKDKNYWYFGSSNRAE